MRLPRIVENDMTHDQSIRIVTQGAIIDGPFTTEEAKRLKVVRTQLYQCTEYLERVMDEHRLKFVRYLIEQGDLSDVADA